MTRHYFILLLLLSSAAQSVAADDKLITLKPGDSLHDAVAAHPSEIRLSEGVYRLSETLVLDEKNAGLTITGVGRVFIVGSRTVEADEWKVSTERSDLWKMKVPAGTPEVRSLFYDGKTLPRSRSMGYRQLAEPHPAGPGQNRIAIDENHLYVPKEVFDEIQDFDSAFVRVIPKYPWVCHLLPVTSIDKIRGLIHSKIPGTYPMLPPAFGRFPDDATLWIENTVDGIDQPGEWAFNSNTRDLFLKTPDGKPPGDRVDLPLLTELIRIEGRENAADFSDYPVRDTTIRGITFARSNAYGWEKDKTGWGLQHDWEMYDRPTAMLRMRFAENCRVENCRFVNSGATGLRMDLHAQKNTVQHCEFSALGGAGIALAGYGMGYKHVNRENLIADNNIHHIGEHWWHSPGVFVWQSGENRVTHNHIHHVPHNAITVSGRTQLDVSGRKESSKTARMDEVRLHLDGKNRKWQNREPLMHARKNNIGWNDIHHVMEFMADGNAIYVSGAGADNRVHHNFIHDIVGPNMNGTIRVDDDQHEVRIDHNVIARCAGEGILWKGRCDILNNLIFSLRTRTPDGQPTTHQRGFLVIGGPVAGSVVKKNIFVSTDPRLPILFEREEPWLKHGREVPAVRLDQTDSDHNIYWNKVNPLWAMDFLKTQRARGIEQHSQFTDPELVDPANNDFTTQQGRVDDSIGLSRKEIEKVGPR